MALPAEDVTVDIHCVMKWSKLTRAEGRLGRHAAGRRRDRGRLGDRVRGRRLHEELGPEDVTDRRAWIAYEYDGAPLDIKHGGPTRLLVPHLYFWKTRDEDRAVERAPICPSSASLPTSRRAPLTCRRAHRMIGRARVG